MILFLLSVLHVLCTVIFLKFQLLLGPWGNPFYSGILKSVGSTVRKGAKDTIRAKARGIIFYWWNSPRHFKFPCEEMGTQIWPDSDEAWGITVFLWMTHLLMFPTSSSLHRHDMVIGSMGLWTWGKTSLVSCVCLICVNRSVSVKDWLKFQMIE